MKQPLLMTCLQWVRSWQKSAKYGLAFGLALVLLGCEEPKPLPVKAKTELIIEPKMPSRLERAIYSAHLQLDPHFVKVSADASPVRDLFVGLMAFDPQGNAVPAVGKQFETTDGKTWKIRLDGAAKWSNGEAVTAYDFSASWRRLASPNDDSPLAEYLIYMGVENAKEVIAGDFDPDMLGVQAIGRDVLQIRLNRANFQLPKMLAHVALLPSYQGKKPTDEQPLVSNGAYQLKFLDKTWLDLQAVDPNLPFQTVRYQLISTIQNPERFDIIENPLDDYKLNEMALPRLCTYFYEFNFEDKFLAKKEVRQAIRSMISSSEISRDWGIPNYSVLPKTMAQEHYRRVSQPSAEQLFHQLGIDPSHPLKINLTFDNETKHSNIAYRIARTLGQSDLFRINLQPVDWKLLLTKRSEKNFHLIRSGWCVDYDDPVMFLMPFHSQSPDNKSGYANFHIDKQLEKLATLPEPNERKRIIDDIVRELENDVAILPLFQYQRRVTVLPEIRGVELNNTSEVIYSKDLYRQ